MGDSPQREPTDPSLDPAAARGGGLSVPPRLEMDPVMFEVGSLCTGYVAAWIVVQAVGAAFPAALTGGWLYLFGPLQVALAAAVYVGIVAVSGPTVAALPARAAVEHDQGTVAVAPLGTSVVVWALHVLAAGLGSVVLGWLLEVMGLPVQEQQGVLDVVGDGTWTSQLIALALGAVVFAPMAEEWAYRKMLFRRLWHRSGPWLAWSLPALVFAGSHFNPSGFAVYAWLGLVFASAYRMTGRIGVAVGVHAANNALTLVYLIAVATLGIEL